MGTVQAQKAVVLGDEYDEKLRVALKAILKEMSGHSVDRSWGVGGSQELEQLSVAIGNQTLQVESETYIGLTIRGDSTLVDRVVELVKQRLASATAQS